MAYHDHERQTVRPDRDLPVPKRYFRIAFMKPNRPEELTLGLNVMGFLSSEYVIFDPCVLPPVPRRSLSPESGPADSMSTL